MQQLTKKAFREYLNAQPQTAPHRERRYRQLKRPYGDYLYAQDRDRFNVNYAEWLSEQIKGR